MSIIVFHNYNVVNGNQVTASLKGCLLDRTTKVNHNHDRKKKSVCMYINASIYILFQQTICSNTVGWVLLFSACAQGSNLCLYFCDDPKLMSSW